MSCDERTTRYTLTAILPLSLLLEVKQEAFAVVNHPQQTPHLVKVDTVVYLLGDGPSTDHFIDSVSTLAPHKTRSICTYFNAL